MKRICLLVLLCLAVPCIYAEPSRQIKDEIISHCRESMGDFGPSMVKSCVDQDIAAHEQLAGYSSEWEVIIQRCKTQMLSIGGWKLVQSCADQDISAEKALRDM